MTANRKSKKSIIQGEAEGPATLVFSSDPLVSEIQRKIVNAFEVFDQGNQKIIDVREVGSIVRALDLFPTEAEVHEIIENTEESSTRGYVKIEKLVPFLTKVILEGGRYKPITEEMILQAYQTIDRSRKGILDPKKFKELLTKEGEPFTTEEVEDMFNAMLNKDDGLFHYEQYLRKAKRQVEGLF